MRRLGSGNPRQKNKNIKLFYYTFLCLRRSAQGPCVFLKDSSGVGCKIHSDALPSSERGKVDQTHGSGGSCLGRGPRTVEKRDTFSRQMGKIPPAMYGNLVKDCQYPGFDKPVEAARIPPTWFWRDRSREMYFPSHTEFRVGNNGINATNVMTAIENRHINKNLRFWGLTYKPFKRLVIVATHCGVSRRMLHALERVATLGYARSPQFGKACIGLSRSFHSFALSFGPGGKFTRATFKP
jgi:hypothetical protein